MKLDIMDVKLHCDLFNMLVRSTTSYACEVWVDSKKIKVIKVVFRTFLKSLLRLQNVFSTSIVLAEFDKFPFEHFAWGQLLMYYNCVNTITKDCILGKAWEAQLTMLVVGKKCWAGFVKKWLLRNQPQEVVVVLFKHSAASGCSQAVLVVMKSWPQPQSPDSHANMAAAMVAAR